MRITLWLLILFSLLAVIDLHWNGLPDFLKRPILKHLHDRGYDAQFTSMRLGWGPSIIVDDASFHLLSDKPEPQLTANKAILEMTPLDLARAQIAIRSFVVSGAQFRFPAAGQSNSVLSLDDIHLELDFISTNFVFLTNTFAAFHGVRLELGGQVSHPEAIRNWTALRPGRAKTSWQVLLDRITDIADQIHFAKPPRVDVSISGDARDLDSMRGYLRATVPDVSTPWGDSSGIEFDADCSHLLSTNVPMILLQLVADHANTPWARSSHFLLSASCSRDDQYNFRAKSQFTVTTLNARWSTNELHVTDAHWDGSALLNATNFHLLRAEGGLQAARAVSTWGSGRDLHLIISGETNDLPAGAGPDWGPWAKIAPYHFTWSLAGADIDNPKLQLKSVSLDGNWNPPIALVNNLQCALYGGSISGNGRLNVGTREALFDSHVDFDVRRVVHFMTPAAQKWFAYFDWNTPPDVTAQLSVVLPAWTNRHPNWSADVRPTLQLAGAFNAPGGGAFRGVPVKAAASKFGYTNRVWTLPHLHAALADGPVSFSYSGSDVTHQYYFLLDSLVDPNDAKALLPPAQQHWFSEVQFSSPPKVHAEIWGRWHAPEETGVRAQVTVSNLVAHGEKVDGLTANLTYTNRFLTLSNAHVAMGPQFIDIGAADVDLATKKIEMTNVVGFAGVDLLRRVSVPRTPKFLNEIQFDQPANVRLSGVFQIGDPLATDMRFAVEGQGFHFTNLTAQKITGAVRWRARDVLLTNIQAGVYNTGSLTGWCTFDYRPKHGCDFRCNFGVKDVDLPALATGLAGRTNKLEGMLDGNLVMVDANSTNEHSWNGFGSVHVHNALLWDIKLFGIFSPVLNAFSSGSGDSRAYDASANFAITNGVLLSDDLVVHSTGFRLNYSGTIDGMTKEVNARAEAEFLRDTHVFGALVSTLLTPISKLFEYKITGSVRNPKIAPVYIPEPFMLLLRPFHTLKTLTESVAESGSTNAPPASSPPAK